MSGEFLIPPAFLMIAGAFLLPFVPKRFRSAAFLVFTLSALVQVFLLPEGRELTARVMSYDLNICRVDALSRIFGIIFALIAFAGGIYAFHIKDTGQQCSALLYGGGALGVTFAGDFFTLFMFWELMAVGSVYLIWARRNREARRAGFRYIIYHVLGGGILFMGILLHWGESGSLKVAGLSSDGSAASWMILLGVGINAAIPPLHTWLSDAYPRATVTGAVFLSAFTTKTAVYVLIRLFPGWDVLLIAGSIMAIYGVIFAILSNDIRGILAYHIISQVGYMVAGVGVGTYMALNGASAHAFSHILYKALLFMGAGVVLETTGKVKLTELGGLQKYQKLTLLLYMVAAFSISGFPLFNGFISKSMVVAAAGEASHPWAMLGLLLASVGTFLSVGLKLPYYTWFGQDRKIEPKKAPLNMHVAMGFVAFFCILTGISPSLLYRYLPHAVHFHPFTVHHLVETIQILIFTFTAFWLMRTRLIPHAEISLDFDWIYRRSAPVLRKIFIDGTTAFFDKTTHGLMRLIGRVVSFSQNPVASLGRSRGQEDTVYSPDRYRPLIQTLISLLLAVLILLILFGLLSV
jgi:multicomponent Na+:H+ antiporter subunit D